MRDGLSLNERAKNIINGKSHNLCHNLTAGHRVTWIALGKSAKIEGLLDQHISGEVQSVDFVHAECLVMPDHRLKRSAIFHNQPINISFEQIRAVSKSTEMTLQTLYDKYEKGDEVDVSPALFDKLCQYVLSGRVKAREIERMREFVRKRRKIPMTENNFRILMKHVQI